MSILRYGDIDLGLVRSVELDQKPVYEDSGTDVRYFLTTLSAETIFTVLDKGLGLPNILAGERSPAAIMARMGHMLMIPRQPLFYAPAGGVLIDLPDGLDSDNGPKPQGLPIITPITDRTFRVRWKVAVALPCPEVTQPYATNRWESNHTVDKKGYSTFTTTGSITVRSDMRTNPDQLRGLAVPPLPNDFHREYDFRLSKDGLELNYQIRDEQEYLLPPDGCVDADEESAVVNSNGGAWEADVRVTLEGRKTMPRKALCEMATLMAMQRIRAFGPIRDRFGHPIMTGAEFRQKGFENRVSVHLRARLTQNHRVFVPGGAFFDFGRDLIRGMILATQIPIDGGRAARQYFDAQDRLEAEKKREVDLERKRQKALAQMELDSLLKSPPWMRVADPPPLTKPNAPGLDPGFEGNLNAPGIDLGFHGNKQFRAMLGAAFRDPCFEDSGLIARVVQGLEPIPNTPKPPGSKDPEKDAVKTAESNLRTLAAVGTSRLRTFSVTDLSQFDKEVGATGYDDYPGAYEAWICDIEQTTDSGSVDVLPATVAGAAAKRVQCSNPVTTVTVKFSGAKLGFQPEVPVVCDDNLVHIKTVIKYSQVDVAADGMTPKFMVAGVSVYKAIDPDKVAMRPAVPPWMAVPMNQIPSPVPRELDLYKDANNTTSRLRSQQR